MLRHSCRWHYLSLSWTFKYGVRDVLLAEYRLWLCRRLIGNCFYCRCSHYANSCCSSWPFFICQCYFIVIVFPLIAFLTPGYINNNETNKCLEIGVSIAGFVLFSWCFIKFTLLTDRTSYKNAAPTITITDESTNSK